MARRRSNGGLREANNLTRWTAQPDIPPGAKHAEEIPLGIVQQMPDRSQIAPTRPLTSLATRTSWSDRGLLASTIGSA